MSTALHVLTFLEPLRPYLEDPAVSEVMINQGGRRIFIERFGRLEPVPVELEPADVESAIIQIGADIGEHINGENPRVEARFDNGDRAAGALADVSIGGATLTIRRFGRRYSLDDLVYTGTLSEDAIEQIAAALKLGRNILIAGSTGTGKTTLVQACLDELPDPRRIILIESTSEITLACETDPDPEAPPNLVRLQARRARPGRAGEPDVPAITIGDLVRDALRHRPDVLVVGEVRGAEAADLLQALNSGHMGSVSTIHANRGEALNRLEDCAAEAGTRLSPSRLRRAVRNAIQLVVYIERLPDGRRVVTEVESV